MAVLQIVLVVFGVLVAVGGGVLIVRSAGRGEDARKGYLPLGMIVVGLVIAYRAYSGFGGLDSQDITIMFLFGIGLLSLLGLQFFVVEKNRHRLEGNEDAGAKQGEGEDR